MAVRVGIIFDDSQKQTAVSSLLKKTLKKVCAGVLEEEGHDGLFEISISFVDDDQIRVINRQFRDVDAPTDVLSFPLSPDGESFDINAGTGAKLLGDIVISLERASAQADEFGHSFKRETAYLTAHSMLHLLGYDHVDGADVPPEKSGPVMREKEEKVLEKLGITREAEATVNV